MSEITLFTSLKHRINNTGWMMKWRWREGLERGASPNILRECWTFLIHIFLHQLRKHLSRILRFQIQEKFADICLVLTIQTVIPVGLFYLTFECENKQGNHCNWHKSLRKVSEKFSIVYSLWRRRKPLQLWSQENLHSVFTWARWYVSYHKQPFSPPTPPRSGTPLTSQIPSLITFAVVVSLMAIQWPKL